MVAGDLEDTEMCIDLLQLFRPLNCPLRRPASQERADGRERRVVYLAFDLQVPFAKFLERLPGAGRARIVCLEAQHVRGVVPKKARVDALTGRFALTRNEQLSWHRFLTAFVKQRLKLLERTVRL